MRYLRLLSFLVWAVSVSSLVTSRKLFGRKTLRIFSSSTKSNDNLSGETRRAHASYFYQKDNFDYSIENLKSMYSANERPFPVENENSYFYENDVQEDDVGSQIQKIEDSSGLDSFSSVVIVPINCVLDW